jgi:hypothetical protein
MSNSAQKVFKTRNKCSYTISFGMIQLQIQNICTTNTNADGRSSYCIKVNQSKAGSSVKRAWVKSGRGPNMPSEIPQPSRRGDLCLRYLRTQTSARECERGDWTEIRTWSSFSTTASLVT